MMVKRKIFGALLVASVFSIPVPAFANHGEPVYNTIYYSDATYTQQVGFDQGECFYFGAGYSSHTGQSTNYIEYQLIGYCANDGHGSYWEPL
ncbi:MAG: hypothetical protein ABIR60_08880 [Allosphingosinicella sp.]